jgi:hypothetical protein
VDKPGGLEKPVFIEVSSTEFCRDDAKSILKALGLEIVYRRKQKQPRQGPGLKLHNARQRTEEKSRASPNGITDSLECPEWDVACATHCG